MMQRSTAIDHSDANDQMSTTLNADRSNVKSKIRLFHEKSQSLDLDSQRPDYHKSNAKLINQDCYNRVRQKSLQKSDSEESLEEKKVRIEVKKLNQWLMQKSMENKESERLVSNERRKPKRKLLRSSTVTEEKTLLPQSAFQSFDLSGRVRSIEDEINKLTIEADIHHEKMYESKTNNNDSQNESDLLLEAKLIRTDGKLAKLASIDELIEYEQGEKGVKSST